MRRLFVPEPLAEELTITGTDAHHLMHVMRAKLGNIIEVAGADGKAGRMEIAGLSPEAVQLRLVERLEEEKESPVAITLYQCILKGEKMDFVVQKAVELGAVRLVPVVSRNVVVRLDAKKQAAKCARWQKIADEAAKQCGRSQRLAVDPVMSLEEVTGQAGEKLVFCYELEEQQTMGELLKDLEGTEIPLLIGAEGGFTEAEAKRLVEAGAHCVTLGSRILRAETAALVALAILQYEKGDLGGRAGRVDRERKRT